MIALSEADLDLVGTGGVAVFDGAVEPERLARWLAQARELQAAGALTPGDTGRMGAGGGRRARGDRTEFVAADDDDSDSGAVAWADAAAWFDELGASLARGLRVGLPAFSLQLAAYPPGAGYVAHRDALAGDPSRQLTAIVYLDPAFGPADGGELVAEVGGRAIRIAPLAGRLVIFRSDTVVHRVQPGTRERWALTAWFGHRGQRRSAARSPSG